MWFPLPCMRAQVCNNLVLGVTMAGLSEGLALGRRLGLDPQLLSQIFNISSARCWSSEVYNPCPVRARDLVLQQRLGGGTCPIVVCSVEGSLM